MRYAIFTDIHANLEALEAVLTRIDEIAAKEPVDQIWFLGDLVGYGPNPNECIEKLRARTDVIIAGNHDWAAVGKIDLEDFSAAARVSAEWTAQQLTEEHRDFLKNLPERLEIDECTLVHGSPFGPLWEYLTSEALAERSFQHFTTRYCVVGHTHIPIIFQQPDDVSNAPTIPLAASESPTQTPPQAGSADNHLNGVNESSEGENAAPEMAGIASPAQQSTLAVHMVVEQAQSAYKDPESGLTVTEGQANALLEQKLHDEETRDDGDDDETVVIHREVSEVEAEDDESTVILIAESERQVASDASTAEQREQAESPTNQEVERAETVLPEDEALDVPSSSAEETSEGTSADEEQAEDGGDAGVGEEAVSDENLNAEIEELLALLGLSQSMMQVTNEMLTPPEGPWSAPEGYRAIINPGGVGQPRDGDPRAAFMVYDTEAGFEFYRVTYEIEKTQEKIVQAGLPPYLAVRLAYGR